MEQVRELWSAEAQSSPFLTKARAAAVEVNSWSLAFRNQEIRKKKIRSFEVSKEFRIQGFRS
jgi:hypothetical protein